jgi:aspartate aminotransferase-like enzyme
MARPLIPHRSPEFSALLGELDARVRPLFGLGDRGATLVLPGSGTSLMESTILSLMTPGSDVVVCANGKFSARWAQICRNAEWLGCTTHTLESEWGHPIDPDALGSLLGEVGDVRTVVVVHSETSTATVSDLEGLASVVRTNARDALLIADAITSCGAMELEMDRWGVDACVVASQKSPGMPPGAGLVALSERARAALEASEGRVPLSIDLRWHLSAFQRGTVACTPPIAHCYGLLEWATMVHEEGLSSRIERVACQASRVRHAMAGLGLSVFSESPSPSVTALEVPGGRADEVRSRLREEHAILVAGGQEELAGRVIRIGHMGSVADEDIEAFIEATGMVLQSMGVGSA